MEQRVEENVQNATFHSDGKIRKYSVFFPNVVTITFYSKENPVLAFRVSKYTFAARKESTQ